MGELKTTMIPSQRSEHHPGEKKVHSYDQLLEKGRTDTEAVLKQLKTQWMVWTLWKQLLA